MFSTLATVVKMAYHDDQKTISQILKVVEQDKTVSNAADDYFEYFEDDKDTDKEKRHVNASDMSANFYDIVTDFYEYGWGESFHFAKLNKCDSRELAMLRHEYRLAVKLEAQKGDKVLVSTILCNPSCHHIRICP